MKLKIKANEEVWNLAQQATEAMEKMPEEDRKKFDALCLLECKGGASVGEKVGVVKGVFAAGLIAGIVAAGYFGFKKFKSNKKEDN